MSENTRRFTGRLYRGALYNICGRGAGRLYEQDFCLIILNMQLTGMDSIELLQTMRHIKHTPILVLTVPLNAREIVNLFHAGADTYLEKPLNMDVCVAQANALMQLYLDADTNHSHHGPIIRGSKLIISPRYRQVIVDGKPVELTRKEFDLLHCRNTACLFIGWVVCAHIGQSVNFVHLRLG